MVTGRVHRAEPHRSAIPGIEAFALTSNRSFSQHAHDHFGIGVLHAGAHRSWSGIGHVEAGAGDVITVNPGEMHDGDPVQGRARSWRMLYFASGIVARALCEDVRGVAEIARPVVRDPVFAHRFARLFVALTARVPDALDAAEGVVRMLAHLQAHHGTRPLIVFGPPTVTRAHRRLTDAPE